MSENPVIDSLLEPSYITRIRCHSLFYEATGRRIDFFLLFFLPFKRMCSLAINNYLRSCLQLHY